MTQEEQTQRFYAYIWPHRAVVLRTAQFLTRNAVEAEDLAQETLMRAFRKIHQFDVSSNPQAWMTSILRHVRIDRIRLRGGALLSDAQGLDAVAVEARSEVKESDPRDLLALLEELSDQRLIDALYAVPEEIRWAILLVDVQQLAYEEAAEIMDVPPGTVKSRVHRGRRMLRDRLLDESETKAQAASGAERRIG